MISFQGNELIQDIISLYRIHLNTMLFPTIPKNIIGNDINIVIRNLIYEIKKNGIIYESSKCSMNHGKKIQEIWNTTLCLSEPRNRIFKSALEIFNPGHAVARFLYLLSGSDLLEPIEFYAKSVRSFSDDGKTIPGSSYGARIFSTSLEKNQFEIAAQTIMNRQDTKRALITIYNADDLGRSQHSKDIPCAANIVFMPRNNVLHMTVSMRANDAIKLLPYNIFEFSLLQECMAVRTGMDLGTYWHTAVSMHIRGEHITLAPKLIQETTTSCGMQKIKEFSETTRLQILQEELYIKNMYPYSTHNTFTYIYSLWEKYPAVWADILSTLVCEAFRIHSTDPLECLQKEIKKILTEYKKEGVLLNAYFDFLSHQKK